MYRLYRRLSPSSYVKLDKAGTKYFGSPTQEFYVMGLGPNKVFRFDDDGIFSNIRIADLDTKLTLPVTTNIWFVAPFFGKPSALEAKELIARRIGETICTSFGEESYDVELLKVNVKKAAITMPELVE
jgi:hypothetical protein